MTHPSDEYLSAFIDGEDLPSDDAAHVDGCTECQERLDALRGVVAVIAAPVTLPAPHVREAAVAAALVETTGTVPAIRRLVPRRDRASAARRMSTLSAAAALVVALGVGGWAISQIGHDSNDSINRTALKNESDSQSAVAADTATNNLFSSAAPAAGGSNAAGSSGLAPATAYDAGPIGDFSDIGAVAHRAGDDLAQPPEEQARHAFVGPDPCGSDDGQTLEWHASLTYRGEAAYARVWRSTEGFRLLQVQRQTDCVLLATQAL